MTPEAADLVLEYRELPLKLAWRYMHRHPRWADDLRAAAIEGLCQAAVRWDPDKTENGRFEPWACTRIEGALKDHVRRFIFTRTGFQRDEAIRLDETIDLRTAEPTEDDAERVEELIRLLPTARDRWVARALWVEGRHQADIALVLGVTPSRVSQIASRNARLLHDRLRPAAA